MEPGGRWPRARRSDDQILEMHAGRGGDEEGTRRGRAPADNYHFRRNGFFFFLGAFGVCLGLFSDEGDPAEKHGGLVDELEVLRPLVTDGLKGGRLSSRRSAARRRKCSAVCSSR